MVLRAVKAVSGIGLTVFALAGGTAAIHGRNGVELFSTTETCQNADYRGAQTRPQDRWSAGVG